MKLEEKIRLAKSGESFVSKSRGIPAKYTSSLRNRCTKYIYSQSEVAAKKSRIPLRGNELLFIDPLREGRSIRSFLFISSRVNKTPRVRPSPPGK